MNKKQTALVISAAMKILGSKKSAAKTASCRANAKLPRKKSKPPKPTKQGQPPR